MSTEEPLIYTIRGNLPVSSLTFGTEWRINDGIIVFTEWYKASDGEIVRQDSHVYDTVGVQARALAAI